MEDSVFVPPSGPGAKCWCPRHWQPFREGKLGGVVLTVKIHQTAFFHPRIKELLGVIPDEQPAQAEHMNRAFAAAGPLCCMLGDAHMEKLHAWLAEEHCHVDYAREGREQKLRCHRALGHEGEHEHFWPPYELPDAAD